MAPFISTSGSEVKTYSGGPTSFILVPMSAVREGSINDSSVGSRREAAAS